MIRDISSKLHTRLNTIIHWRDRFIIEGIGGLHDMKGSGKPMKYPADLKIKIIKLIEADPPQGHAVWNGTFIAKKIGVSDGTVGRYSGMRGFNCRYADHGASQPMWNSPQSLLM